ncbi:transposase [Gluconobacter albidus]|uniref:transposase n=2 Tax=Gluconobacter albidus TaxID=318683 RepID=UPI003435D740
MAHRDADRTGHIPALLRDPIADLKLSRLTAPAVRGFRVRPEINARFLNGMLHVLRIGCPRRDMHECYGQWNSVYVRFRSRAEQGVWDALLQTPIDLGLTDDWQHMLCRGLYSVMLPSDDGRSP